MGRTGSTPPSAKARSSLACVVFQLVCHDLRTTLRSSLRARQQARGEGDNRVDYQVEFKEVQLYGDVVQPCLRYRIVTNRGEDCGRLMAGHVKTIFREVETLNHPCWMTLASRTCATAFSSGPGRTV